MTELEAARALVTELEDLFRRASRQFRVAANNSNVRLLSGGLCLEKERVILAGLYVGAADFVSRLGLLYAKRSQPVFAHADEVFAREVISHLDAEYRRHAVALRNQADFDVERIRLEYRRLVNLFAVPIDCFERKRFGNLSHAPNKAMNLNSYIGLIGRAFRVSKGSDGMSVLKDCPESEADLIVPAADSVITIDADSIILPDYIGKLVSIMQADPSIAICADALLCLSKSTFKAGASGRRNHRYSVPRPSRLYCLQRDLLGGRQCGAPPFSFE